MEAGEEEAAADANAAAGSGSSSSPESTQLKAHGYSSSSILETGSLGRHTALHASNTLSPSSLPDLVSWVRVCSSNVF